MTNVFLDGELQRHGKHKMLVPGLEFIHKFSLHPAAFLSFPLFLLLSSTALPFQGWAPSLKRFQFTSFSKTPHKKTPNRRFRFSVASAAPSLSLNGGRFPERGEREASRPAVSSSLNKASGVAVFWARVAKRAACESHRLD